jgi:RNase P subunit RPR2
MRNWIKIGEVQLTQRDNGVMRITLPKQTRELFCDEKGNPLQVVKLYRNGSINGVLITSTFPEAVTRLKKGELLIRCRGCGDNREISIEDFDELRQTAYTEIDEWRFWVDKIYCSKECQDAEG